VHVTRLRRKLEAAGAHDVIRTVRGIGYALAE
jgi:DNA-binding response OmpR family regulator